jgi:polygalacturonase
LNGNGAKWWDGEGTNGGKTKPKFFYAHSLTGTSSITGLNILNTPVQCFSVNSATGLTISDVTIDNSAGDTDELGHNTDAFDVGSSTDITISGANVKNQDDCLAVNSGTVSFIPFWECENTSNSNRASLSPEELAQVVTVFPSAPLEAVTTTPSPT